MLADINGETLEELRYRHPAPPDDLRDVHVEPNVQTEPFPVSAEELQKAIKSFHASSAGGFDGLRPRHLKDMLSLDNPTDLQSSLLRFCERVINGKLPDFNLKYFYGAFLTAFRKKSGGLRPIACGLTLRRLASKILVQREKNLLATTFLPNQLGCGVHRGGEAAVHAVRTYLENSSPSEVKVMVKLDYKNAFNTVRRDWLLERVAQHAPSLLPMSCQAYGSESLLLGDGFELKSQTGVQQGDPCGPALFCLAIKDLTDHLSENRTVALGT